MFTFDQGDQVASFAVEHDMKLRGHTLVWHRYVVRSALLPKTDLCMASFSQLPDWVSTLQGNDLLNAMNNHVTTVMQHFKGMTFCWDVVNEVY